MIKNQKQASFTRDRLTEIKESIDALQKNRESFSALEYELSFNSLLGMAQDLENELNEYEQLKAGKFCYTPQSLLDIPKAIIAARLALNLSQRELAELLNMKEQQIQRYEASDYETAAWPRIVEVSKALGLFFEFKKAFLQKARCVNYDFMLPNGITTEQSEDAQRIIYDSCLIPIGS
ncbi:MAG: helix-turn-helix transcriptional regulator [Chitinophagales bacterium]